MTRSWVGIVLLLLSGPALAASVADGQRALAAGRAGEARDIWLALAEAGDPEAAFGMGVLSEQGGGGTTSDPATAYCWYRRAAAGGVAAAAFNVAIMHDSGRGATRDAAAAAMWYARAAAAGVHRAEFNLGQLYEAGDGVPRNVAAAAAWYRLAAAGGLQAARDRLAMKREGAPDGSPDPLGPVVLDLPAGVADTPLALTWVAIPQTAPVVYTVEVVATEGTVRKVFSMTTQLSGAVATLPAGRYAARVFTAAADGSRYVTGPWTRFEIGPVADLPACQ